MKTIAASILALTVLVALVLAAHAVLVVPPAHAAEHSCSAAMVKGPYGFTFSGFFQDANGNNLPLAGTGTATSDGQGNVSATINGSFNGSFQTIPYTAIYVVNSDCSISVTSTNGNANFSGVVVRGGAEIFEVSTNPGDTWTVDLKRIE